MQVQRKTIMTAQRGERFFFVYSMALFLIVVTAFPIHALVNRDHLPPIRPMLHLHALLLGSWYALMVLQTGLIGRGRIGLHRSLGLASLLLVASMLPTGIWVSYENMLRTGNSHILIANSASVTVFLIFYGLGLAKRTEAALHKRFMLYAGLALMLPAFGRVTYIFELSPFMVLPMWLVFLLAVPVYDLITERKIKKATAIALGVNLVYIAALLAVGPPPD
ncbi:MAG: hypothetical protein ACI80K_004670 [Paracoccaceae bacterium]